MHKVKASRTPRSMAALKSAANDSWNDWKSVSGWTDAHVAIIRRLMLQIVHIYIIITAIRLAKS